MDEDDYVTVEVRVTSRDTMISSKRAVPADEWYRMERWARKLVVEQTAQMLGNYLMEEDH